MSTTLRCVSAMLAHLPYRPLVPLAGVLAALLPPGAPARASGQAEAPVLRIETGMHTSWLSGAAVDASSRYLVTSSRDSTARVWELPSGRLLRAMRPPLPAPEHIARSCAAISPDGRLLAIGAGTGAYICEWRTLGLFRRLPRLAGATHLAFSRDGRFLAAFGDDEGCVLRVYRMPECSITLDERFGDPGPLCWDGAGRLVAFALDGLRLYGSDLKLAASLPAQGNQKIWSGAITADGARIAVGYRYPTAVGVLSGKDLSSQRTLDTGWAPNENTYVGWSTDGRWLYATDGGRPGGFVIRKWEGADLRPCGETSAANRGITALVPLSTGGLVVTTVRPDWTLLGPESQVITYRCADTAEHAKHAEDHEGLLRVSDDGATVEFAYKRGNLRGRFSVPERRFGVAAATTSSADLRPPLLDAPLVKISDWRLAIQPFMNGKPLTLPDEGRACLAFAVSPDQRTVALSTGKVHFLDANGTLLRSIAPPGYALALNIAANGLVLVASLGDGTIRWYRLSDGKELLAFFPHADRRRWVVWTPAGYYDCSPGGVELIGWHVSNGPDQPADFFPASRFRDTYYRPGVISRVLQTLDEAEALRLDDEASGRRPRPAAIAQMLPPVVTLLSPADGDELRLGTLTVRYTVKAPADSPVTGVKVLVDGRPAMAGERGAYIPIRDVAAGAEHALQVPIPPRDCEISLLAENRFGASVPAVARVIWKGAAPAETFVARPKLYVLAVGVSGYQDPQLRLRFAAKDAADFVRSVQAQQGRGLYREVVVKALTDAQATRDEIVDGLDWILHETTSKDVAMVFLSGHGVNDERGNYYFLPANLDRQKLMRTGVPWSDIKRTVEQIAGKVLFFVDSCHSGNVIGGRKDLAVDATGFVNELASAENGAVVFAASTGTQVAFEDPAWGNGAFTKALVEGLAGKADYTGKGRITINMLDLYLSERVKELTAGRQTPTTTKPQTVPDFPVAVMR